MQATQCSLRHSRHYAGEHCPNSSIMAIMHVWIVPVIGWQHHSCVSLPIAKVDSGLQCFEVFLVLALGRTQGTVIYFLRAPSQLFWNVAQDCLQVNRVICKQQQNIDFASSWTVL